MRAIGILLVFVLAGCAQNGTTLPQLPAWQVPAIAPSAALPDPQHVPALRVALEAQIRYPGIPVTYADGTYTLVSRAWLDRYCDWEWQAAKAAGVTYTPESFDCDDFSLGFYFFATLATSRAGERAAPLIARLVVQYDAIQRHELCGAATDAGLVIIEPQPDAGAFRVTPLEKYDKKILSITFGDLNPGAGTIPGAQITARGNPIRPDPKLTPGAIDRSVTVASLNSPAFIKAARNVPQSEKNKVYAEYGITSHAPGEYEIDHLISLELGGSNDIANLWPQSYSGEWNAHLKDRLENELHRRVQAGKMPLHEAQARIAADWIALYALIFPGDVVNGAPKPVGRQANAEPDDK